MIEIINPKSEADWHSLRAKDVTSTEAAALYGVSPYTTRFELAHRKRSSEIVTIERNERMKWGQRLQNAIAQGIAEDQGWEIRPMTEYIRDTERRMGASFDFAIGTDEILEIKALDYLAFRDGWLVDGDSVEAPPHIELQVQHQLAVSGRSRAYIGALVSGNRVVLIKRDADASIISSLRNHIARFWDDVLSGRELKPDFTQDAGFIAQLYAQSVKGKVLDVKGDAEIARLAADHAALGRAEKTAKEARDAVKAQLLIKIGDAEKVIGDEFSISASTVEGGIVEAHERKAYRRFGITFKKASAR
jgi:putative phage-type endonuclease